MNIDPGGGDFRFAHLELLASQTSAEQLEEGVEASTQLLACLKASLNDARDHAAAARLLASIDTLQGRATSEPTIVGVVGNTGSGKSSVINAVVNEERIIPTNCMRACTAVITELSYNHSDDPKKLYNAEIEFISMDDWKKELSHLFGDLSGSGEASQESAGADLDAGAAWDKLKAVYPALTKSKNFLTTYSPAVLADDPSVRDYLGKVKTIDDESPGSFYEQLQKYVDSKEKVRGRKKDNDSDDRMELWPLIKVVRIYLKSEALSTGLVLVDLPGAHDSNAARAAVAEGYLKNCTALWIVAPISRAVDDKTSQQLMGSSFKRQIQLDGTYDNMTFICSKTDDISVTEALQNLSLTASMEDARDRRHLLEKALDENCAQYKPLNQQIGDLKYAIQKYDELIEELEDKLSNCHSDGRVLVRTQIPQKRKAKLAKRKSRKRPRRALQHQAYETDFGSSSSSTDGEDDEIVEESLSLEEAKEQLQEFKSKKKFLKKQKKDADAVAKPLKVDIKDLKAELKELVHEQTAFCISRRNEYSRPSIKYQFAQGIRELDMEAAAAAEDEDDFNPDQQHRDYEEVAKALPVFCVSSRAFQKLQGRSAGDAVVPGFVDVEETEIPSLVQHAKMLTEKTRVKSSKKFLNKMQQLLNSVAMWIVVGDSGLQLADDQKQLVVNSFKSALVTLHKDMNIIVERTTKACRDALNRHIFYNLPRAEKTAKKAAGQVSSNWTSTRDAGGLAWMTFKATCRRHGVFGGIRGFRDFNEELATPLKSRIASSWEQTFSNKIPNAVEYFSADNIATLNEFHRKMSAQPGIRTGCSMFSLELVAAQIAAYGNEVADEKNMLQDLVTTAQREANREFTPAITRAMGGMYSHASNEGGLGCYKRCKTAMSSYINNVQETMFHDATTECHDKLNTMCDELDARMHLKIEDIVTRIDNDYTNLIVGTNALQASEHAKEDLYRVLASADAMFREILDTPPVIIKMEPAEDFLEHDITMEGIKA